MRASSRPDGRRRRLCLTGTRPRQNLRAGGTAMLRPIVVATLIAGTLDILPPSSSPAGRATPVGVLRYVASGPFGERRRRPRLGGRRLLSISRSWPAWPRPICRRPTHAGPASPSDRRRPALRPAALVDHVLGREAAALARRAAAAHLYASPTSSSPTASWSACRSPWLRRAISARTRQRHDGRVFGHAAGAEAVAQGRASHLVGRDARQRRAEIEGDGLALDLLERAGGADRGGACVRDLAGGLRSRVAAAVPCSRRRASSGSPGRRRRRRCRPTSPRT